jgi:hypothetical protein
MSRQCTSGQHASYTDQHLTAKTFHIEPLPSLCFAECCSSEHSLNTAFHWSPASSLRSCLLNVSDFARDTAMWTACFLKRQAKTFHIQLLPSLCFAECCSSEHSSKTAFQTVPCATLSGLRTAQICNIIRSKTFHIDVPPLFCFAHCCSSRHGVQTQILNIPDFAPDTAHVHKRQAFKSENVPHSTAPFSLLRRVLSSEHSSKAFQSVPCATQSGLRTVHICKIKRSKTVHIDVPPLFCFAECCSSRHGVHLRASGVNRSQAQKLNPNPVQLNRKGFLRVYDVRSLEACSRAPKVSHTWRQVYCLMFSACANKSLPAPVHRDDRGFGMPIKLQTLYSALTGPPAGPSRL